MTALTGALFFGKIKADKRETETEIGMNIHSTVHVAEFANVRGGRQIAVGSVGFRLLATAFFIGVCTIGTLLAAQPAEAAGAYSATELIRSVRDLKVAPGESMSFTIGFKNTGYATWRSQGQRFVSVYTHGPKYRKSGFRDASWMNDVQPARISEAEVEPGSIGRVTFTLYAPLTEGHYSETFHLASEDTAWMRGGEFTIEIDVREPQSVSANLSSSTTRAVGYKASKLITSARKLTLDSGKTQEFRVAFKNIGRTTWRNFGDERLVLKAQQGNAYSFRHSSWQGSDVVATLSQQEVKPGQLVFFNFTLAAPSMRGNYMPRFVLAAGNRMVDGGTVDIPVEVLRGTVAPTVSPQATGEFSRSGSRGPTLRIGLYYADSLDETLSFSADGEYRLLDSNDSVVRTLSGRTDVTFDLATRRYTVRNGSFSRVMTGYLTLDPVRESTIFEVHSITNIPAWDRSLNFNRFRGKMEIFYTSSTGRLWIVEEVAIEDYLRGLAETSNASPYEYQKALVTAARSYALFVKSIGGKHKREFHDLNTTAGDQVYKGYVSETVRPNVVRAVEDTRGMSVRYNGEMVVTPYFSRSDGRTRAWTEVWGGTTRPWLVSVPTSHDVGKALWGHGVGLAASDAVGRARDGETWQDILRYYYQGTQIVSAY